MVRNLNMTSRDFCYWLQGYFELTGGTGADLMSADKVMTVKNHLALVFRHEIDPSIDGGNQKLADELQKIHDGGKTLVAPTGPTPGGPVYRC